MDKFLDFTDIDVRKKFIQNNESGLYGGENKNGEDVIVLLQQGEGMTVKTLNSKGWYECIDYDKDGFIEGEYLEKAI